MKKSFQDKLATEYIPKIFGYAVNRTKTLHDAEDLSQEILTELLKSNERKAFPEDEAGAERLIWKIVKYVYIGRIRKDVNRREIFGIPEYIRDESKMSSFEEDIMKREDISVLRRELAFLAETRRKIIIWHYLENKKVSEISSLLSLPEGTVKWHLNAARNELKKGMDNMREFGEKSYNPQILNVGIQGNTGANGEPFSLLRTKLAQNILLAAYENPVTLGDLCTELGISAPYMEEQVDMLTEGELLIKIKDKYCTDFPILFDEMAVEMAELTLKIREQYGKLLVNKVKELLPELRGVGFYGSDFGEDLLMWLFVSMYGLKIHGKVVEELGRHPAYSDFPIRPNGGRWYAFGSQSGKILRDYNIYMNGPCWEGRGDYEVWMLDTQYSPNRVGRGANASESDWSIIKDAGVLPLTVESEYLPEKDRELMAKAVRTGAYKEKNGKFIRTIPTFTRAQLECFEKYINQFNDVILIEEQFRSDMKKIAYTMPERLGIQRETRLSSMTANCIPAGIDYAVKNNLLDNPRKEILNCMSAYYIQNK